MGEHQGWLFEPTFTRSIKLRQADPRITSDAGALLLREVDHRPGLTADLAARLIDPRCPRRRRGAWDLVEHYRKRGTFEDRLGEFNAVIGNGLSAGSFAANEAALLLKLLACNLAGMIRGELEDSSGSGWDLKRVQQTVLKAGARVTEHGRRIVVDVAREAGVLWRRVLQRVQRWWRDATWGRPAPRPRQWVPPPAHAHLFLVLRE